MGIETLVKLDDPSVGRIYPGCFLLMDEMGAGKTLQVVATSQALYERQEITRVLVIAPAGVKSVWFDEELGEIRKHLWAGLNVRVREFHSKMRSWKDEPEPPYLDWLITNYEFIRAKQRLNQLLPFCTNRTLLITDESAAIKNHRAEQTKACLQLRRRCGRVILLNGTPIPDNPGDMYSQGQIMDPRILGCTSFFLFRSKYAVMGGWKNKQIIKWHPEGIADIQRRFAPYVLRRLKTDCLDLPEKMPTVVIPVALDPSTWDKYVAMRDELVAWLSSDTFSMAPHALTRIMRLSQITSGYLGGMQGEEETPETQEISREKLDAWLAWLGVRLAEDPNFKVVVWSRFSLEIRRALLATQERYPEVEVGVIAGGYKPADRERALRLLDPRTAPPGPVVVLGNPQSGGLGLNLTAAAAMMRLSSDYSLFRRVQADDRIHRPGQARTASYFDLVATGPKGQRTIDHAIFAAVQKKADVANWTCQAWASALT